MRLCSVTLTPPLDTKRIEERREQCESRVERITHQCSLLCLSNLRTENFIEAKSLVPSVGNLYNEEDYIGYQF